MGILIIVICAACYLAVMCSNVLTVMRKTQSADRVILHTVASFIALVVLVGFSLVYVLEHNI